MTPFTPDDRFNLLERATVISLSEQFFRGFDVNNEPDPETGIGGYAFYRRGNGSLWNPGQPKIRTVHTKINRDGDGEPEYYEAETPAIGISCIGQQGEEPQTLRRNLIPIGVVIDIVVYSGDRSACDKEMSKIAAVIQSIISKMTHALTPLDGYFTGASGGGYVESDGVVGLSVRAGQRGWVGEAALTFTAMVRDEGH